MQTEHTQLVRGLGLIAAISVNVANIIGTGVFLKARVVTCNVGSPGKALAIWVFAGLLSIAGALTYAELLAMMPRAAGEYGIIRDAYGRRLGFVYGWTQFLIARTASAAALAVGFAIFLNDLVAGILKHPYFEYTLPGGHTLSFGRLEIVALSAIIVTTAINCAAVRVSGAFSSVLTGMKIALLIAIGTGAFFYSDGNWANLGMTNTGGACTGVAITTGGIAGLAAAMIGALWAYDGWNNITFLAGEVKNPARNLPLALIGGGFLVMALYLFVNVNYYHVLTPTQIADVSASSSVAAEVVRRLLGSTAVTLMAAAMMTSSFGALHASLLATARVPYALAKDGLAPSTLSYVSPRTHVPIRALLFQGTLSCLTVLTFSAAYDSITDYAVFALTLFYILVTASVFIFRKRLPDAERTYRVWGYPFVPIIFLVVSTWLIIQTISNHPRQSGIGLALILLALPVYWILSKRSST
ncbi:MAG TPA: amino acid permease [Pyrinomonadaceae bacterium]|nr:amino acid permease [Pyrinomonadaceae bacterium]